MAIHNAFSLAQQCGTWTSYHLDDHDEVPLISCFGPLPTLTPFVKKLNVSKAVTFSSTVDIYKIDEDEIGNDIKYTLSDQLDAQPRMHHINDDHVRRTPCK